MTTEGGGGGRMMFPMVRSTPGIFKNWTDECLVSARESGCIAVSVGDMVFENGQTWKQPAELILDMPSDGRWYTVFQQIKPAACGGYYVTTKLLLGLSYDYDTDKIVLASVRRVNGQLEVEDRRQFAMVR